MVKIDKGFMWPELALQFLTRDHLSSAVKQHTENLKRLTLQTKSMTFSDQLA
jgi:hypothetical protein